MLSQTYYDLKSDKSLPPNARFVDPYDHTPFITQPGESITDFTSRIASSREEKKYPAIEPESLRQLVVDSLYHSTKPKIQDQYFVQKSSPPTLVQTYSFIRATAETLIRGKTISPLRRQLRARHCNSGCKFHAKSNSWGQTLGKIVSKVVGIKEATTSEEEHRLGVCMMCGGCSLQVKVGYSLLSVLASINPDQLDTMLRVYGPKAFDVCWIFKESLSDEHAYNLLLSKLSKLNSNTPRVIAAIQTMQQSKNKSPNISLR